MQIILKEQLPDKQDYFDLFITTGWNSIYNATPEDLELANKNSWIVLSAYDGGKLVGFGRVVTDFVLHAMIYDMIVYCRSAKRRTSGTSNCFAPKARERFTRSIRLKRGRMTPRACSCEKTPEKKSSKISTLRGQVFIL
jgi:hypothetical protein